MEGPAELVIRGVPDRARVRGELEERIRALERFFDRIVSCRVVVEPSSRRHETGNLFRVLVELTVPGQQIVVQRDPPEKHSHEDVEVAIRDAFKAARRQLEDYARIRRDTGRIFETALPGTVAELVPEEDSGFLQGPEGDLVYFHRDSVADGAFDRLRVGMRVRYEEEAGEEGPRATWVRLVAPAGPAPIPSPATEESR
jgi:cold shock CspA family protein/ribosome-associated translation inhibitor RaiA